MSGRDELKEWVVDALKVSNGSASVLEVCKYVWDHHETDLRHSGDLFFTWQYDIRWAATYLRKQGILVPAEQGSSAPWMLAAKQNQ